MLNYRQIAIFCLWTSWLQGQILIQKRWLTQVLDPLFHLLQLIHPLFYGNSIENLTITIFFRWYDFLWLQLSSKTWQFILQVWIVINALVWQAWHPWNWVHWMVYRGVFDLISDGCKSIVLKGVKSTGIWKLCRVIWKKYLGVGFVI